MGSISMFGGVSKGDPMVRRMVPVWLASALLLCGLAVSSWAQESLGDAARSARMQKSGSAPGARVYTNETLPTHSIISISGTPAPTTAETKTQSDDTSADSGAKADAGTKPAATKDAAAKTDSAEDQQKAAADWKQKIDEQKNEISRLERELNVLQREGQIRSTVFYADAGTQLRDPKKYADDVRKNQDDMAAKQKALDEGKQKLDDMQEEARKAGVPASSRD